MSRAVLDVPTYRSAADQLLQANHHAAGGYTALTRGLADSGAMAGDDATSEEFSDAYDEAAAGTVTAYADLVASFTTLGRLVARSADNHRRADAASVLGSVEPFDPADPPSLLDGPVEVVPYEPPSSVGGDGESSPPGWGLVADQLEGWVWPSADVDRLRSVAEVWRRAAAAARVLPTCCDAAVLALEDQASPEIPLAVEAVSDLGSVAGMFALSCDQLADSCEGYADQVEAHRETVKEILAELAIEIAATVAASAILSAFSGGAAAAGGATVIAARVSSAAGRVLSTLRKLKRLAALRAVGGLTSAVMRIGPIRTVVTRFASARHLDEAAYIRRVDDAAELETIVYGKTSVVRSRWYRLDDVSYKYKDGTTNPLAHIRKQHWPNSAVPRKSRFHQGITESDLRGYLAAAMRHGVRTPGADHRITFDLGKIIGTTPRNVPTSTIAVIVRDGVIRTAYPCP